MKRLDLSCLPLNLEVGEIVELIDKDDEYHLLKCVPANECSCGECFSLNQMLRLNVIE